RERSRLATGYPPFNGRSARCYAAVAGRDRSHNPPTKGKQSLMIGNLKTTVPPVRDARDDTGDDREKRIEIDGFEETALPPKLMALTKSVNRQLCENVEVILGRDGCFLYWDERHPEMVTQMEYVTGKVGREALEAWAAVAWDMEAGKEKRREHDRLYK